MTPTDDGWLEEAMMELVEKAINAGIQPTAFLVTARRAWYAVLEQWKADTENEVTRAFKVDI